MGLISNIKTFLTILLVGFGVTLHGQTSRQRITATKNVSNAPCTLNGAYRIDVAESDKLYSVVKGATSKVPFGDQQRFFMDLSVRLTPPDMLAIECRGNRVSVGSSRSPRVTFIADGKNRNERAADGSVVHSRVGLENDVLTFTSNGKAEDNVNVTFAAVENGKRLRVTRQIYAEQLTQPIVIQTVYNKIADVVKWDTYSAPQVLTQTAKQDEAADNQAARGDAASRPQAANANGDAASVLRDALEQWIDATNKRDIEKQMSFYMPQLKAFYLTRNASRSSVRLEKNRVFAGAKSIDIRAEEPEIIFQDAGRTAIMRFNKKYNVADKSRTRNGEVVQELRWQQSNGDWRIFSERDVKVIR
jgi:ketosteroid isomerase-like protein